MTRPRIVLTVTVPTRHAESDLAERKNRLYAEAVRRAGGDPILLDGASSAVMRESALARMDGLVLTGGADVDPVRYGQVFAGAVDVEPERDELEAAAWGVADERGLPVLGLCRGMQEINVLLGGSLVQHVEGHVGAAYGHGEALMHPIELVPGTRLAAILDPEGSGAPLEVNSYHHQAVVRGGFAPGLRVAATADAGGIELVEGLEAPGDRFVVGVQCHPERTESTPPEFEGLWRAFVDACRRPEDVSPG
jgi:putative glutamine amidotransferase